MGDIKININELPSINELVKSEMDCLKEMEEEYDSFLFDHDPGDVWMRNELMERIEMSRKLLSGFKKELRDNKLNDILGEDETSSI